MTYSTGLNGIHLICNQDFDCNAKILNSHCAGNNSCVCERGYRYYSKFKKCIFSNHFNCEIEEQCANLDPQLTCINNYCTCKEKEKRTDNYLCTTFRKYCYKGYRYNVETTDCVFVGDLKINQLENLDQSVEIFVIVLFFITSALFIASCINNYQNERREKLRRRIAQQQTMSLFAEQRRRIDLSSPMTEVRILNDDLFRNHNNQMRNTFSEIRRNSELNLNRHHRYQQNVIEYMKSNAFEDLPPSYEECMKNEEYIYQNSNPSCLLNKTITENSSNLGRNMSDLIHNYNLDTNSTDVNHDSSTNDQSDQYNINCSREGCLDNQIHNQNSKSTLNYNSTDNSLNSNKKDSSNLNTCHINENDSNNNMAPVNIK